MHYTIMASPIGPLLLGGDEQGLSRILFARDGLPADPDPNWVYVEAAHPRARQQLNEYFAGARREFDLRLAPKGTDFQLQVWRALREIPYGRTCSYGALAQTIGRPRAVRAVGAANGRNPLPIVVPCHRVIGADGSLTGFGGGLAAKEHLINLESGQLPILGVRS